MDERVSYQLIKRHSVLVLALRNKTIARKPVIEDIVEEQTRAVLLFDTLIWRGAAVETPYPNRDQRLALRCGRVLSRYTREDESDVSAYRS